MWKWLSTGWQAVLEVLYPRFCPICHKKLLADEPVACEACIASIPRTEHMLLPQNGIDMLFAEHIHRSGRTVHYVCGAAFAYYNRERGVGLRTLIEQGKFGTHPDPRIFYFLGRLAAQEYMDADMFDDVDFLVPVPLHPRRLRERGFNQAEWICKGMSDVLHIPIDTEHLVRTRHNPHQSRSLYENRQANVKDLFAVRYPEEWKKKHVLLVDDVITSGATMYECMKQMTPIRGCRVSVFALGWTHR